MGKCIYKNIVLVLADSGKEIRLVKPFYYDRPELSKFDCVILKEVIKSKPKSLYVGFTFYDKDYLLQIKEGDEWKTIHRPEWVDSGVIFIKIPCKRP